MSRLEEALRLSNNPTSPAGSGATRPAEVFESPWSLEERGPEAASAPDSFPGQEAPEPSAASGSTPEVLPARPVRDHFGRISTQWLLSPDVDPALVEQFRRLAASLLHGQREGRLKVVMITSAVPGEGKTLTALNLALVLAESYRRRVLLIDADLRRPRLSEASNLTVTAGLSEVLKDEKERKASITQLTDTLWFLPAGRPDPEPLRGLTSPRMQKLLEDAAERFDWVIVDTPPVVVAADSGLLAAIVDATVLVVRAGQTQYPAVRQAVETLKQDRIFGVVLNGVNRREHDNYRAYDPTE